MRIKGLAGKIELAVTVILFAAMLLNCGRYINIKINGRSSAFSGMPENDKRVLFRTVANDSIENVHDLVDPLFIGFKSGDITVAAAFDRQSRSALKTSAFEYIVGLFSGKSEKKEFADEIEKQGYLKTLENCDSYLLLSFFNDIPASAFLPSIAKEYESNSSQMYFNVQNLFILPDIDGNAYAVAISSDLDVNIIKSDAPAAFNRSDLEAYNDSKGFVSFAFEDRDGIFPVFASSFSSADYSVKTSASVYGRQTDSEWIMNMLSVFGINANLARSFLSADKSSLSFVDDKEIVVSDNGYVTFNAGDGGTQLSLYLGYYPDKNGEYSFADKIASVKNIVNLLGKNVTGNEALFCLSNVSFDEKNDTLTVGLKYFVNGISVTENDVDAEFKIRGNEVCYARFLALVCTEKTDITYCMPQNSANRLFDDIDVPKRFYGVLSVDENGTGKVKWAMTKESEN